MKKYTIDLNFEQDIGLFKEPNQLVYNNDSFINFK